LALLAWLGAAAPAAEPPLGMIELKLKGQKIEGQPLFWDDSRVHLLGRDGRLWEFAPGDAAEPRQTADRFRSYSPSELRAALLRELGQGFEVTGTGHYLVAHAAGERDKWAERFETLHRAFVHYFSTRSVKLQEPPTPLVGVVCRNQAEFTRYAAQQGIPPQAGVLGWYSPVTNRIIVYDMGGSGRSDQWQQNASVIIHEATHQTAFNTGIHSRYVTTPKWVAEGLAMMFEAPGVYNSRLHPHQAQRINRTRLDDFQKAVRPQHRPETIAAIVAKDDLFGRNPGAAYAQAWALTFFLVETMPQKYAQYLARTAQRPPFASYTTAERTSDFTAVFGNDWRMLEAKFLRFTDGLK
jgi:hypothetical protein